MKGVHHLTVAATSVPGTLGTLRTEFGFKVGVSGTHSARTMMLADLTSLLSAAPAEAKRDGFCGVNDCII
jgi:hypothetical protein